jgi:hypothetical protein
MARPAKLTRRLGFAALLILLPLAGCYYPGYYYAGGADGGAYYARPYAYGYGYSQPYAYLGVPYGYYGRPYGYYGRPYGYGGPCGY